MLGRKAVFAHVQIDHAALGWAAHVSQSDLTALGLAAVVARCRTGQRAQRLTGAVIAGARTRAGWLHNLAGRLVGGNLCAKQ